MAKKRKASTVGLDPPAGGSCETLDESLSPHDLEATLRLLGDLARSPHLLARPACRALRAALHPHLVTLMRSYDKPTDYQSRVTAALRARRWDDAIRALRAMRARGQTAKQGTVQRWVRECDAVPAEHRMGLLERVLRATDAPVEVASVSPPSSDCDDGGEGDGEGSAVGAASSAASASAEAAWASSASSAADAAKVGTPKGISASGRNDSSWGMHLIPSVGEATLRVVHVEPAAQRTPPNAFDLRIFACTPETVRFDPDQQGRVRRERVAGVAGAFVLHEVLSKHECAQLLAISHRMGFSEDEPVGRGEPYPTRACEWLVDASILVPLWERTRQHLPDHMLDAQLHSINARWRLFEYPQGAVYRPHIDGSWPASGLVDGQYVHDVEGPCVRSRLTFLIYLNDDFDGGETSFFVPRPDAADGLEQIRVQPRAGSVLCFPQSSVASLLHEGSPVIRGVKFVARSDVMYGQVAEKSFCAATAAGLKS